MVVIRTFKDGVLFNISTWEIAGALNNVIEKEVIQRIQVNLVIKMALKRNAK